MVRVEECVMKMTAMLECRSDAERATSALISKFSKKNNAIHHKQIFHEIWKSDRKS